MSRNKKIIPDLRFPEFEKDGEWKIIEVGDVFNVTRGNVLAMNLVQENKSEEFPYPVFSSQTKNNGLAGFYKEYLYENAITWTTDGANAGDVNYRIGKFYCTNVCGVLLNEEGLANLCIAELINSVSKKHVSYIGNPKLMNGVMSKIKIPIPSITEQQKIASCLSSLDEVIDTHSQRLELFKDHKKGLMQKLFPQEDEKVPKFRFPEFEKEEAWVKKRFEKVYDFKITNSFSRALLNYEKGEIKNIHYGDIHTKFKTLFDIEIEDVPFINPDVSIENIDKENYCLVGDIVFADASEDINDIGKSIELTNLDNQRLLAGLHTLLARQKQSDLSIGFGGYLFKSDWIRKQIQKEAQGAKVLGISKTRINNISISFPKNKKEQQKIASCLSALDELITAEANKIEQLQQHKKGLLQGLFPKIEN